MNIDISQITSCGSDWETNHYTFLKTLKSWQSELRKSRLFPVLEDSKQLHNKFNDILNENIESKGWLDREVRGAFINDQLIVLEKAHQISFQLERLIDFVKWALNVNNDLLEEAEIIKQFVYDGIDILPLSDTDKYRGKGYIVIPDNKKRVYKIYLYELSISWTVDEPVEYLDMDLLRSIPFDFVENTVEELINQFIKNNQLLYDPMVYICKTELDFPFNETVLPVVEEKLLEAINGLSPFI
ncbi:MAG: hypothetical protein WAV89_09635 [Ignavibacteriaceae bacterium]